MIEIEWYSDFVTLLTTVIDKLRNSSLILHCIWFSISPALFRMCSFFSEILWCEHLACLSPSPVQYWVMTQPHMLYFLTFLIPPPLPHHHHRCHKEIWIYIFSVSMPYQRKSFLICCHMKLRTLRRAEWRAGKKKLSIKCKYLDVGVMQQNM